MPARVLVACEFSGVVRDAFLSRGADAVSCDLLESEAPGPHIVGDVCNLLGRFWDIVIAHPPCTYLCLSGARWLYEEPDRFYRMEQAAIFFVECLRANARFVAVENPTMHGHARRIVGRGPDFCVQPWMFGHGEVKRTCFHVRGLPALNPTSVVDGRVARVHKACRNADRWKDRSRTYAGIARAMADQWLPLV